MKRKRRFTLWNFLLIPFGCFVLFVLFGFFLEVTGIEKPAPTPTPDAALPMYLDMKPADPLGIQVDGKGKPVIGESGKPYISGRFVIVDIDKRKFYQPNGLAYKVVNNTRPVGTIIWLHCHIDGVGVYTNGLSATQDFCNITVIDKAKDQIVGEHTIAGAEPPNVVSGNVGGYGGNVPDSDIMNYVLNLPEQ